MYPLPTLQEPRQGIPLIIAGAVLAPLGVLGLGVTSTSHSVCSSGQAVSIQQSASGQVSIQQFDCAPVDLIFYLALLLLVVGVAMVIIGIVRHGRTGTSGGFHNAGWQAPGHTAPPGWYPDPTGAKGFQWWDGTRWRPKPGWYPDPTGAFQWWDGTRWTGEQQPYGE